MILAQNKTTFKIKCHMFSITLRKFHIFPLSQKIIFDKNFIFKYQMGGNLNCLGGNLNFKGAAQYLRGPPRQIKGPPIWYSKSHFLQKKLFSDFAERCVTF